MRSIHDFQGVYLHREPVDMRKSINGLSAIVELEAMGELQGRNLFIFTGRRRDVLKMLYFDRTGFALWTKRLEKDRFPWPRKLLDEVVTLSAPQLEWLLDGVDVWQVRSFENFQFERAI